MNKYKLYDDFGTNYFSTEKESIQYIKKESKGEKFINLFCYNEELKSFQVIGYFHNKKLIKEDCDV